MTPVLMVPGLWGSGPDHWQSLWQRQHAGYSRVEQRDWDRPEPGEWTSTLDAAVTVAALRGGSVVLVGHSLGCMTIVRWAAVAATGRIAGALLVAPADAEAPTAPTEIRGFSPIPTARLPFPTHVVASSDDPLITIPRARALAASWGSRFTAIDGGGHINTASGHGSWPEGHRLLEVLLRSC